MADSNLDLVRYVDQAIAALRALVDQRHASQTKATAVALAVAERASDKADEVLDRRLAVIDVRLARIEQRLSDG